MVVLPLVLDYATTVHSVQGRTIKSKVIIDMSNVFDFGMGYVAISRNTNVDDMFLLKPLTANDLRVPNLKRFYGAIDDGLWKKTVDAR
jgi:hypothetical protein